MRAGNVLSFAKEMLMLNQVCQAPAESILQTWVHTGIPWSFCQSAESDPAGLGWGPSVCLAHNSQGMLVGPGHGPHLGQEERRTLPHSLHREVQWVSAWASHWNHLGSFHVNRCPQGWSHIPHPCRRRFWHRCSGCSMAGNEILLLR